MPVPRAVRGGESRVDLEIRDEDAISDEGAKIWSLYERQGIRNVVVMGVHMNMCVLCRPFGLRQMVKNGKNVALMRDLCDTIYDPHRIRSEARPFAFHFAGTDVLVEYIERYVCPTITSADLLGGEPLRFRGDRRSILAMLGEDQDRVEGPLARYVREWLAPYGFRVVLVPSAAQDEPDSPGLIEALQGADLLLVSLPRRLPEGGQLAAIRGFMAAGKPVVGLHAADPGDEDAERWRFGAEVLGFEYRGSVEQSAQVDVAVGPEPSILRADLVGFSCQGPLYQFEPLDPSASPQLIGWNWDTGSKVPVAWTLTPPQGGRVLFTSLGHADDLAGENLCRLLLQGICWALTTAEGAATVSGGLSDRGADTGRTMFAQRTSRAQSVAELRGARTTSRVRLLDPVAEAVEEGADAGGALEDGGPVAEWAIGRGLFRVLSGMLKVHGSAEGRHNGSKPLS